MDRIGVPRSLDDSARPLATCIACFCGRLHALVANVNPSIVCGGRFVLCCNDIAVLGGAMAILRKVGGVYPLEGTYMCR